MAGPLMLEASRRAYGRPASLIPGHKKLHKFPFKAKLDLRGLRPVKPEQHGGATEKPE